ncbi:MAG: hypothetical protein K2M97_07870, partial [Muribaculaceae bacterium]|nr:hypothetical protein [Muribaculaceae bacterium]
MKHSRIATLLIALAAAVALLLGSCAGRHTARALDRIALLADTEPDSALALLDSIAPHLGNSDALRARHTALTAYAKLKVYNEIPDRDAMEQAAKYFFNNPTPPTRHHALAFYLLGMAREADSLYVNSLVAYTHAEQAAKAIDDYHLLGLIYRCTADVYDDVYNSKEAVHYSELSLKEFQKGSPQPFVDYAMLDLALQYNKILEYPQSLLYADSVIARAYDCGDISLLDVSYRLIGCIAMAESRWNDAIDAYLRVIEITDSLDVSSVENLATAFINVGKFDRAKYYLDKFVPHSPEYSHAYSNYNIVTGNYPAAIRGLQQDVTEQDRVIRAVLVQNVSSSVRESFENETRLLDQKVRTNRTLWISISVIALLTIALLVYAYQVRMLHQRNQVTEALSTVQELTVRLNATNSEFKTTSQQLHDTTRQLDFKSQLLSETTQVLSEQTNILN